MSNNIQYPKGFGRKDIVFWGTGLVCLDATSQTVIKTAHGGNELPMVSVDKSIYERFNQRGGHDGMLRYYGPYESGIRLEYAPKWNLSSFLQEHPEVGQEQRLRWAHQVTEALCFVHGAHVIHGDLTCHNIFLTEGLNTKIADFGGSSLDGSELLVSVTASHEYPGPLLSAEADIFALGSVYYTIITGNFPYHDLSEDEITASFEQGRIPDTQTFGAFGAIIRKCW